MTPTAPRPPLRWPPPGLERLQGDLWRVAGRGALSGGTLVLPLVFVVTRRHEFSSLGPFADAWWVLVVLAAVGLGFAMDALTTVWRLARRVSEALASGYDAVTVFRTLGDVRKDMGFLLQGSRHFSMMQGADRERLASMRVLAAAGAAAAGIWLPVVLGVALLSAARGVVGPDALWMLTLLPAGALYVVTGVLGAAEESMVRKARRAWFRHPWAQDLDAMEIEVWRKDMAERIERPAEAVRPGRGTAYRRAAVGVGALAVVVALPVLTLVPASAIGPLLALIGAPRFSALQVRAARAEGYRAYRVEADPAVDPQEAGRILQDLLYVGAAPPSVPGERAPGTRYEAPWLPSLEAPNPVGSEPHRWPEEIFARVVADPSPDLMAFLDSLAAHPAHAEFARLARASALDGGAGRWTDPFPEGVNVLSLPMPRIGGIREGAYAHVAAAAADLARGRQAEAETKIREVISVGFLMGDDGSTLIDNVVGHVVVGIGGEALERFYAAAGRPEEARQLRELAAAAERAAARVHAESPEGTEAFVRSLPAMILDTSAVRGQRWESLILATTLTPCLNLNRMVFGPDDAYRDFLARARASLVRWPSERQLFDMAEAGYWGAAASGRGLFGRLLGISMRPGEGSCNDVVKRFDALREIM
jgi:hypothetical protein